MSIDLPPELEAFVQRELATGQYESEDQVYAQALRILERWRVHELRREIQVGIDQLDRGEGIRIEDDERLRDFFDEIIRAVDDELDSQTPANA